MMKRLARRPLLWLFVGPFVLVAAGFVVIQLVDHNTPTKAKAAVPGLFEENVAVNFEADNAGKVRNIREVNGGTGNAWITNVWIEEEVGGSWVKAETNFKIVGPSPAPSLPTLTCHTPPPGMGEQYLDVLSAGTACEIGIQFVTGTHGKNARYVLEYEEARWCILFGWYKDTKIKPIKS